MLTLAFAADKAAAPATGRKVNQWLDDRGGVFARAFSRDNLHWIEWRGVGIFAFSPGSTAVWVWPEPDVPPEAVVDPFSRIQPIILQALGWQALHAGASVGPTGVLAFCGSKGAGKSTLAFAMRRAGWRQFADDALVLRLDRDRVTACPFPFVSRLRPSSRTYFADADNSVLPLPERQLTGPPLAALFLLRQDADLDGPRMSLISPSRAFSELLTYVHCFDAEDPTHKRRLLQEYLELVARVPVFTLEYRPNFECLPQLTRAVVDAASSPGVVAFSEKRPATLFS